MNSKKPGNEGIGVDSTSLFLDITTIYTIVDVAADMVGVAFLTHRGGPGMGYRV